jgi:hypothetical protein
VLSLRSIWTRRDGPLFRACVAVARVRYRASRSVRIRVVSVPLAAWRQRYNARQLVPRQAPPAAGVPRRRRFIQSDCAPADALRDATGISVGDITTRPGERLPLQVFQQVPTLAWFIPRASMDTTMEALLLGCTLVSALIAITGACAAPAMLVLWAMYLSLTSVGQDWYSFGWEMQLCETAFLFIFVCPLWWQRFPQHDLPLSVTWLMRWLLVRIMLGNGLIKLRGDECWRDLTCMNYFYHTQPVPNPLAPTLHALPGWVHKTEVLLNHFIECVAPFFLLLPQPAASIGGAFKLDSSSCSSLRATSRSSTGSRSSQPSQRWTMRMYGGCSRRPRERWLHPEGLSLGSRHVLQSTRT